jgi:hypothetical protein
LELDFLSTLLNPGVLFFILGLFAVMVNSNLDIPESVVKFLSLYLMMAIGFKGGVSLHTSPLGETGLAAVVIVLVMSAIVPVYVFFLMRRFESDFDAAALGGVYGSNSTLTYITAAAFLTSIGISYGGYMTVALVIMETPAVIFAIMMAKWSEHESSSKWSVLKKALTDGTLVLLLGSMIVGYLLMLMGNDTSILTTFISGDMFTGMLIFFLLYMGTLVGKKIKELEGFNLGLIAFSLIVPLINGMLALWLAVIFDLPQGSAFLLIILCASSSYIVAPAIIKDALPEANPAKYLTMSMGITFPFNIIVGIPMYWYLVTRFIAA